MDRRRFLALGAAGALAACSETGNDAAGPSPESSTTASQAASSSTTSQTTAPDTTTSTIPFEPQPGTSPFGLGVASGDPTPTGFVIWTRLVDGPAGNPAFGGPVDVSWSVSTTPDAEPLQQGVFTTDESVGHSVHVDVDGLEPGRIYFYRFSVDGNSSPTGRARTSPTSADSVRVAFASCQNYEDGYFGAWDHMVADGAELVVMLGDMIYTRPGTEPKTREYGTGRPDDLDSLRRHWALHMAEPPMQRARAAMSVCAIWDDNEVISNYAADAAYRSEPSEAFSQLRRAAYQAWWEHQPVRTGPPDQNGNLVIHRRIEWGDLVSLWLLDERQYRSPHVCNRLEQLPAIEACEDIDDPSRTMLGEQQERWLGDGLAQSSAAWQVLASQTVVADWLIEVADIAGLNHDQWDGYAPARERLLNALEAADRALIVSGDVHLGAVNSIAAPSGRDFTEIVTPSISSDLDAQLALGLELTVAASDRVAHFDTTNHGYVLVDITPGFATGRFRHVDASTPDGGAQDGPLVELNGRGNSVVTD